jgi:hypothetical protein
MTRAQAIEIIRERGDDTPYEDIEKFCAFVDISKAHFFDVIERFRNPAIWRRRNGVWMIEDFLILDWQWA